MECRIISLDIRGAFDSVWWDGLLQHLWSIGMRSKAYSLMRSYLCDRTLFVVAHGDTLSRRTFTAGVPQGGIWSPILFNLFTRHLPAQVSYCSIFSYADDSTLLKVIPTKADRIAAAEELNADLRNITHGARGGSYILSLISVIHFVCPLRRILISTYHCLWTLCPLQKWMC